MKIRINISIFVNLVIDINYVGKKEGEAKVSNFILLKPKYIGGRLTTKINVLTKGVDVLGSQVCGLASCRMDWPDRVSCRK